MSLARALFRAAKGTAVPVAKLAIGGTAGRVGLGMAVGGLYGLATNDRNDTGQGIGYVARMAAYGGLAGGLSRLLTPAIKFGRMGTSVSGMPLGLRAAGKVTSGAFNLGGMKNAYNLRRGIGPRMASGAFSSRGLGAESYTAQLMSSPVAKTASAGSSLINSSLKYPMLALGAVGGIYALNQTNKTPYDSNLADSSINQPIVSNNTMLGVSGMREVAMLERMESSIAPTGMLASGAAMRNKRLMNSTNGLVQGLNLGRHG